MIPPFLGPKSVGASNGEVAFAGTLTVFSSASLLHLVWSRRSARKTVLGGNFHRVKLHSPVGNALEIQISLNAEPRLHIAGNLIRSSSDILHVKENSTRIFGRNPELTENF